VIEIGIGSRWRHKKRGTEYQVIDIDAGLRCSSMASWVEACFRDKPLVIYRSLATGKYFVRPLDEFADGRFEFVRPRVPKPEPTTVQGLVDKFNEAMADIRYGYWTFGDADAGERKRKVLGDGIMQMEKIMDPLYALIKPALKAEKKETKADDAWPFTAEEWFRLPMKLRERWWNETDYLRRKPSDVLLADVKKAVEVLRA